MSLELKKSKWFGCLCVHDDGGYSVRIDGKVHRLYDCYGDLFDVALVGIVPKVFKAADLLWLIRKSLGERMLTYAETKDDPERMARASAYVSEHWEPV